MSIKEIKEMPSSLKKALKETDRDRVLKDFNEAIEKHISVFEFEGDYNFKTLGQKAKEVAKRKIFGKIYSETASKVERELKKEFPKDKYIKAIGYWNYEDKFFKVKNIKKEDRVHVYASIDYDFIEDFYALLLEETREYYKKKESEEE